MKFSAVVVLFVVAVVALFESPAFVCGVSVDRHTALRDVKGKLTLDEPKEVAAIATSGNTTGTKANQTVSNIGKATVATKIETASLHESMSAPGRGGIGGGSGSVQGTQMTLGAAVVAVGALMMTA
mmetsp:Transcript_31204/g.47120  ORF Transcript_31204/g.47120 Transcript_31204/m.47120 type:complete len:126 (-) Transcript_31204:159-536(-)|eukprot:CAMPEP_0194764642 /NCGR_PEP_ID=MMETSP0323_2-20130528/23568_1 /TAXON_ID=2866 ORGANISM="Crypthecodinium cohnii, Strain Seligo" /NCGR_SAMPLE_ID=MMETSP0323_2 /ASSEMBLY_ACC=CAM_ASM_000346 /LENGTH=125 /DNA_ID=CAMNT_0039692345 /DNA_START=87 /DNA_END=464 /DNA_ORIENTATION=+